MIIGVIILVLVMLLAGVGTYFAVPNATSQPTPVPPTTHSGGTCQQNGLPCAPPMATVSHDATVTSYYSRDQAGGQVEYTATISHGTPKSFAWWFGDGSEQISTVSSVTHTYDSPGWMLVYVQVTDTDGNTHDNAYNLLQMQVLPSTANDPQGDHVLTSGSVTANGTGGANPTSVLRPGGTVTLSDYISGAPTNANTVIGTPTYVTANGASASNLAIGTTSGNGQGPTSPLVVTVTAGAKAAVGDYAVNFTVTNTVAGGFSAENNFTTSIFVGTALQHIPPVIASPHPQSLQVYEYAPGGAETLDPSIDYESVGGEVVSNIYEALIQYNGSQAGPSPNGFVPDAAMCVPGTAQCTQLYGTSLISPDGYNYTFVIRPTAQFYDPYSSTSWKVWPADVLWSYIRTCLFSVYPFTGLNPGWIQCQSLLPIGNPNYDSGLHYPYNNTPANLLDAITLNNSAYCTAPMMNGVTGDGCVTFDTWDSGVHTPTGNFDNVWPFFLELVADQEGGAIQSCAFENSEGFNLAGWTGANGCTPPSPSSPPADDAWDAEETEGAPTAWNKALFDTAVGSGPYYLQAYSYGQSYAVKESPVWVGTSCAWQGCLPGPAQITAKYVSVDWETTPSPGETAYKAGTADLATIPPGDTPTLLSYLNSGVINAEVQPTANVFFLGFNMAYAQGLAQQQTTQNVSAPSWVLQDLNMRQFLVHAFPYQTDESEYNTVDGVQYGELYGGIVPRGYAAYPTNLTWPSGDPVQNPSIAGGAAWWWNRVVNDNWDGASCTPTHPCSIPFVDSAGDPYLPLYNDWASWVSKISGGAVTLDVIIINFNTEVTALYTAPGESFIGSYQLGWSPDYPDASDNMVPMLEEDGTFTGSMAWLEGLTNTTTIPGGPTDLMHWSEDNTCAGGGGELVVTNSCQGEAYTWMNQLIEDGNACTGACSPTQRNLYYNMALNLSDQLGMYIYFDQQIALITFAPWISPSSFNDNPSASSGWDLIQYT